MTSSIDRHPSPQPCLAHDLSQLRELQEALPPAGRTAVVHALMNDHGCTATTTIGPMMHWAQSRRLSTVRNNSLTSTSEWFRKSRRLQVDVQGTKAAVR